MPALVLFGRRWLISTDDVPLPASVCAAFHLVWCCLLVVWFVSVHGPRECSGAWQYDVGVGGLLGSFALSFILEALVVRHGLCGGPFEARKRRLVPRLLYLDFASHVCQVAFNAYCTHLVYGAERPVCPAGGIWDPIGAMMALVWCTWALIALLLTLLVFTYNLFPDYRDPASWERRCNCLSLLLCCSRGRKGQYRDLSGRQQRLSSRLGNIFSMMLSHIDLSPSDILLAFSLAMALQRIQRRQQRMRQQQAGGKAGRAAGTAAATTGDLQETQGPYGQQQQRQAQETQQAQRSGIEMSPQGSPMQQGSPEPAGSVCSFEGLLGQGQDVESGLGATLSSLGGLGGRRMRASPSLRPLLSRHGGPAGSGRLGGGNGGGGRGERVPGGVSHLDSVGGMRSFLPAHPSNEDGDGSLQLGAEKTGEGPLGREPQQPGDGGQLRAVDAETLDEAAWACKYAFASYGMLLFIFSQPGTGCLQLCFGRNCGLLLGTAAGARARHKLDLRLVNNLNREATQQAAGLSDHDLLDVRYEGEAPHVLPHFLAVDEQHRAVVLAIRGSLSLDDVVRDLLFEPAALDEWVTPGRRWEAPPPDIQPATRTTLFAAHAGILEAARATFLDLQEHGVLHRTLLAPEGRCHGWRLVVTGHSLGAGCAFLLALYLRQFVPDLQCWAFSPPGGLASAELCAEAGDWCTSVVCGKEWIPRLSLHTFSRMRDEMVYAALRCRQPKWWVLLGLAQGKQWSEDDLFYRPDELPAEAREALQSYRDSVRRHAGMREILEVAGDFGPPGRCFHLRPTGKVAGGGGLRRRPKQRQYRAVWVDSRAIMGQGILISGRMMADHMPDYLLATLRSMTRSARRARFTATISDRAGERLTDSMMEHSAGVGPGSDDERDSAGPSPGPSPGPSTDSGLSRNGGTSSGQQAGNGDRDGARYGSPSVAADLEAGLAPGTQRCPPAPQVLPHRTPPS